MLVPELCPRFLEAPLCGCTMNRVAAVQTIGLLNMQGKGGPIQTCEPSCCVSDRQFLVHNACSREYVNEDGKTWEDTRDCLILALLTLKGLTFQINKGFQAAPSSLQFANRASWNCEGQKAMPTTSEGVCHRIPPETEKQQQRQQKTTHVVPPCKFLPSAG